MGNQSETGSQTKTDSRLKTGSQAKTPRQFGTGLGIKIFCWFIRAGGHRAAYALLYPVVFYYVLFSKKARYSASHYILRRFPGHGRIMGFFHTFMLILNLGKVLVDSAAVSIKGFSAMDATCPDREILYDIINKTRSKNKGIILLMSHVGCWQAAMSALDFMPITLNMVMEIFEDHDNYHVLKEKSSSIRVIDSAGYLGGTFEIMKALGRNEAISIMGDRVFKKDTNAITAMFLGADAKFPYSAFKIASATGAPVLVLFANKKKGKKYTVNLSRTIKVPKGLGRKKQAYQPFVEEYLASLEDYCQKYPYQFFNFYNMWEM